MPRPAVRNPARIAVWIDASTHVGRGVSAGVIEVAQLHGWRLTRESTGIDGAIADAGAVLPEGLPAVRVLQDDGAHPSVTVDELQVGNFALEHFSDRGFRHFAFVGDEDAAEQRGDGFAQAVAQKLSGRDHTFLREDAARTFSDSEFAAWLLTLPRPLACFCGHDALAARVTRCMSPESAIAVLGVGDDPLICEFAEPPVSSIDINAAGIGKRAGELLARRLHGKSAGSASVKPWGVTERASTRVLAIDDRDVAAALRFIRAQAASAIRIADIVEATSLTRRSLERRFAKLLQRSPAEVLRRERVGIAQRLLSTSDASIGQIARRSGFALPQHLAAAFRQSVGQTPSDYRQQRRAMPGVQK